uniref:Uncharacterized protein n=1 Tax=Boodleopsis pusilla TaxID=381415 RepID=A0A386AZH6_9CHLO|nr:hypothetical protein [Boodleopsis pusilla]AYC64850.1 hypothetical protein [Boodleopsis pusilla]
MSMLSPALNKTVHFLAGPSNTSPSVLFIEKIIKVSFGSFLWGYACLSIQRLPNSKNRIRLILMVGFCGLILYFVMTDFLYMRQVASLSLQVPQIHVLASCQLGRCSLLIGCTLFLQTFCSLPGTGLFFMVCIYVFGIWSLIFSASTNWLPLKK